GVIATTAGGAQDDERTDYSPLDGRTVTIWPDNDKAGLEHADRVAAKLRSRGCKVEIVDASALGLPEKGDCVDWLRRIQAQRLRILPNFHEYAPDHRHRQALLAG